LRFLSKHITTAQLLHERGGHCPDFPAFCQQIPRSAHYPANAAYFNHIPISERFKPTIHSFIHSHRAI